MTREEIDEAIREHTDNMYDLNIIKTTLEDYRTIFESVLTDSVDKKKVLNAYIDIDYILMNFMQKI